MTSLFVFRFIKVNQYVRPDMTMYPSNVVNATDCCTGTATGVRGKGEGDETGVYVLY